MYASLASLGLLGIEPYLIKVEVDSRRGMPAFDIVGLPDASVKESRDRVKSAIQNLGYPQPMAKIVANLAPADTRKIGSVYDLPILLALIHASGYEDLDFTGAAVIGEIGLDGDIRGVQGVLPMALDAARLGIKRLIVPEVNAAEAAVAEGIQIFGASRANEIVAYFAGRGKLSPAKRVPKSSGIFDHIPDLSDVKGQDEAKRAMEIAAAGMHNILFIGPPGTGKSMLAKRLPSILPELSEDEAIETTKVHSVAGMLENGRDLVRIRPFRSPHHTISPAALTGGGPNAKPGDISLAHNGVLFLDELPEFSKDALEALRQPLEDGEVSISRVRQRVSYPAAIMLVAAMNPCPCGYFGHPSKKCVCSPQVIHRYLGRISGPLLDRIDIHVEVPAVNYEQLSSGRKAAPSSEARERVAAAWERQRERYKGTGIFHNSRATPAMLSEAFEMEQSASNLLKSSFDRLGLSARAYGRILKMSRTIADLDGAKLIGVPHISEAIQYRSLDRKYWG